LQLTGKPYLSPRSVRVFGHRGSTECGDIENSYGALKCLSSAGIEFVETDVRSTIDGEVVLFHDRDLKRIFGTSKRVSSLSLKELRSYFESSGQRVLTIDEALREFENLRFNIDAKDIESARRLAVKIQAAKAKDRVLVTSFSNYRRQIAMAGLGDVATSAAAKTTVLLMLYYSLGLVSRARKLAKSIDALQIPKTILIWRTDNRPFIDFLHSLNLEVHFWTINDPYEAIRLVELGADGIVTDRGKLIKKALEDFDHSNSQL